NGTDYEAPRFAKVPLPLNSVVWQTDGYSDPSMYILTGLNRTTPAYSFCAIRSFLTPNCSTRYTSATGGGNVTVDCSANNPNALSKVLPSAHNQYQAQFKDIATTLAFALFALNSSTSESDAPISYVLAQFALDPKSSTLSATL